MLIAPHAAIKESGKELGFMIKTLKTFLTNFKEMVDKIDGNFLILLFSFMKDRMKYHMTMVDYFELTFYKKTNKEKAEYLTTIQQRDFAYAVDDVKQGRLFTHKTNLYLLFKEQMGRQQLFTESMTKELFLDFTKNHNPFLFKPDFNWCGQGIRKIDINEYENVDDLFNELKNEKGVLDEILVQHTQMSQLNPCTLNSIRVFSFRINNEVKIVAAALRIGRKNVVVDNYSAGGVVCSVDVDTGRVVDLAEDMYGKRYETHPDSGTVLVGFEIPNWDKVIDLVMEAADISPINYVGWDIAILENRCLLIEGNFNPMLNVAQIAGGGGKKKLFEKLLQEHKQSTSSQEFLKTQE